MDAGSMLYEIDNIDKELKRLRKETSKLNKRKKELLGKAVETLKESGEMQVTYRGKTYTVEETPVHTRKTDKKKRLDTISILNEEGFEDNDANEIYDKLASAMRGPETVVYKLKS